MTVTSAGSGEPTLLFVHGFGCARSDWDAQIDEFRQRYHVLAPDLPGHGASAVLPGASFDTLVTALLQVRLHHGGRSVVLIGHSMGCRVILEAVARGLDGLRGLVLIEQNLVAGNDAHRAADLAQERMESTGVHGFLMPAFQAMFNDSSPSWLRERTLERLRLLEPEFARRVLIDSIRWEASEAMRLTQLQVPVLLLQSTYLDERFIWHSLEPGMSTPWTRLVLHNVPRARLQIVSGPGHFLQIEAAPAANHYIREFVDGLGANT